MRHTIEVMSNAADQSVLDYLALVDPKAPREDLAAQLLGFPGAEQFNSELNEELTKQEIFE